MADQHRTPRAGAWRALAPLVFVLAGVLFVASAVTSGGTDLRAGRYGDLETVVEQTTDRVDELQQERNALAAEVERLAGRQNARTAAPAERRVQELAGPAGLVPLTGPGLTVTLDDSPPEVRAASDEDPNRFVVHQQDIQAVVNAMWAGGAEGIAIQGQRIVSTTGIKCVGNTVILHDIPYSPPYVITAVGDPAEMSSAISASPYIEIYLQYVQHPSYQLGWELTPHGEVTIPAYQGSLELQYARPAGEGGSVDDDI